MSKKDKKSADLGRARKIARKFLWPAFFIVLLVVFLKWLLSPVPAVGQSVPVQGRDHIKIGATHPAYNSNPPTSGPHYENPVAAGIYSSQYEDENLLHSLEHGYIIISYNCGVKETGNQKTEVRIGLVSQAWAHDETEASPSSEASSSANTSDEDCHRLRGGLKTLAEKLKVWKLIVVPRKNLDVRIALTAWGRIDKFNGMDSPRIERFIKAYRDQGPEKTKD